MKVWKHSRKDSFLVGVAVIETLFRYPAEPLRGEVGALFRAAVAHGEGRIVYLEMLALIAAVAVLTWASASFVVFVYLPLWYLGQVAAYAENYLEHFGARPGNRQTDSVSCYSRWYNWPVLTSFFRVKIR